MWVRAYLQNVDNAGQVAVMVAEKAENPLAMGAVVSFYLTVPAGAKIGETNSIEIENSLGSPQFTSDLGTYLPVSNSGSVTVFLCGDIDSGSDVNIGDAIYLVKWIFANGMEPIPLLSADTDGSGEINISDALYLVKYLFNSGPALLCNN